MGVIVTVSGETIRIPDGKLAVNVIDCVSITVPGLMVTMRFLSSSPVVSIILIDGETEPGST